MSGAVRSPCAQERILNGVWRNGVRGKRLGLWWSDGEARVRERSGSGDGTGGSEDAGTTQEALSGGR